MAWEVAVDDVGGRRHSGARGNTPWAGMLDARVRCETAPVHVHGIGIQKLAHIRAVHTINETGHATVMG